MLLTLSKMQALPHNPVQYSLGEPNHTIELNSLIGTQVEFKFTGRMFCEGCGTGIKKSFNQGYCYRCFVSLARCDMCQVKPEICHFHQGTCREPEWAQKECFIPHTVYAAYSSGLKIGITRAYQKQTRWLDQGAVQAMELAQVSSRLQSGLAEVLLKNFAADKTNWRKLITQDTQPDPFFADTVASLKSRLAEGGFTPSQDLTHYHYTYPVTGYPPKAVTYNLDKDPLVQDTLTGIKGQYLLFASGAINIRKYTGYQLDWKC
jgi:hypothetical protein